MQIEVGVHPLNNRVVRACPLDRLHGKQFPVAGCCIYKGGSARKRASIPGSKKDGRIKGGKQCNISQTGMYDKQYDRMTMRCMTVQ